MGDGESKALVRRFYEEVNRRNLGIIDELVASDCLDHDAAPGEPPGAEGVKQTHGMLLKAFPDHQFRIVFMVAEEDMVTARWTFRGTHRGGFVGIPATDRTVEFTGTGSYRINGGQIVEHWLNHDQLGLMQQLGVIPGPGQPG